MPTLSSDWELPPLYGGAQTALKNKDKASLAALANKAAVELCILLFTLGGPKRPQGPNSGPQPRFQAAREEFEPLGTLGVAQELPLV